MLEDRIVGVHGMYNVYHLENRIDALALHMQTSIHHFHGDLNPVDALVLSSNLITCVYVGSHAHSIYKAIDSEAQRQIPDFSIFQEE